jgi:hypothetical protein
LIAVQAHAGDWLIVPIDRDGAHVGRAQVVAVTHPDGTPPFRVRWFDDDHESLLIPPLTPDSNIRSGSSNNNEETPCRPRT